MPFAFDGDKNTAWRTVTYYNKSKDKPGVGIVVDLGAPRTIGSVSLDLVGNGTDLQVLTSNDPGAMPQDYDLMAQATEAGQKVRREGRRSDLGPLRPDLADRPAPGGRRLAGRHPRGAGHQLRHRTGGLSGNPRRT